jgi:hypothetical protein
MTDDDEKRRQHLLGLARQQRAWKRIIASSSLQKFQDIIRHTQDSPLLQYVREQQRLLAEGERLLQIEEAKAQQPTTTPETPQPSLAESLGIEAELFKRIEAEIEAVNKEAERRGDEFHPNGGNTAKLVTDRLGRKGLQVPRDKVVYPIAMQDKYNTKRRDPGKH